MDDAPGQNLAGFVLGDTLGVNSVANLRLLVFGEPRKFRDWQNQEANPRCPYVL